MNESVEYDLNRASAAEVAAHLARCDGDFDPPLSGRVEIKAYAKKIVDKAMRFEAWSSGTLVGLAALYCNDQESRIAWITSVSVLRTWMGKGIAARLMSQCVEHAKISGMRQISLEVASSNTPAIKLYEKTGFLAGRTEAPFMTMNLYLKSGEAA